MAEIPIDELTELVIGCAIDVHRALGPGLLESVYRDCLLVELASKGLRVAREHRVPIEYRGQRVRADLRVDLLVDGRLVASSKRTFDSAKAWSLGEPWKDLLISYSPVEIC